MRALQAAVIGMGVLILAGTVAVIVVIVHRAGSPRPSVLPPATARLVLDEAAGTRIAVAAPAGERLVLQLVGGGPDRVLVLDLRTLAVVARIGLAH